MRTTKDQLKLPPVELREIPIEPSTIQKQIYSALKRAYAGTFSLGVESEDALGKRGAAVMTLIAAASNPGLIAGRQNEDAYLNLVWPPKDISPDSDLMEVINNYVSAETPPKYNWIIKFIKKSSEEGKKTIIWSNFIGNLLSMNRLLSPFSPALILG